MPQAVLRRFTRPVYQAGAVLALVATTQSVLVPTIGGPAWVWATVPVAATAAVVLTIKSIPYEHVKFPR